MTGKVGLPLGVRYRIGGTHPFNLVLVLVLLPFFWMGSTNVEEVGQGPVGPTWATSNYVVHEHESLPFKEDTPRGVLLWS